MKMFHTLRPRQNGRHFSDDILKCIFMNENIWISISILLKFVPEGPINNILALVQMMAWRRPADKPLSEPMMISLPTRICVTRPQWDKTLPTVVFVWATAVSINGMFINNSTKKLFIITILRIALYGPLTWCDHSLLSTFLYFSYGSLT